jgi:hypothetical protein
MPDNDRWSLLYKHSMSMSSTSARHYGFFHQQYSIFPFRVFHRKEIADCIQDAWTLSHAQDVTCKDERYTTVEPTLSMLFYLCRNERRLQQKTVQFVWLGTLLNEARNTTCPHAHETTWVRVSNLTLFP